MDARQRGINLIWKGYLNKTAIYYILKFYHFLVVDGWNDSKTKIYINDPADGKYTVNIEEFSNSYTGVS